MRSSILLLLVALAADILVQTGLPAKRLLILCVWVVQLGFAGPWRRIRAADALMFLPAIVGFFLLLAGTHRIQHIAAIVLLCHSLSAFSPGDRSEGRHGRAILHAASLYGVGVILCHSLPYLSMACIEAAEWISRCADGWAPGIHLGPFASGIQVTVLLSLVHVALWAGRNAPASTRIPILVLCQWILLLGFLFLRHLVLQRTGDAQMVLARGGGAVLLLAVGLVPVLIHITRLTTHQTPDPLTARGRTVTLLVAAACGVVLAWPISHPIRTGLNIVIAEEGVLDWTLPNFERYGGKAGGMFGCLPQALTAYGHTVTVEPLTENVPDDADIIVVINPNRTLTPAVENAVWAYVERGGAILAMGDHTGRETIREPLNTLFDRVNIRLNFDSAIPLRSDWQSLEFTTGDVSRMDRFLPVDTQIRIGASLDCMPPAWPFIVGRDGYSDKGNIENPNGYLGDMAYSVDERAGNVILAAGAHYGKGNVLVFGDTTSFQNGALPFSLPFVARILTWLATPARPFPVFLVAGAGILLAGLSVLGLLRWRDVLIVPAAVACIAHAMIGLLPVAAFEATPRLSPGPMAVVDLSHLPRCDRRAWQGNGVGGLLYNLIRNGYAVSASEHVSPEDLRPGDVWVSIAQARAFQGDDLDQLVRFVASGGHLLVTAGWEARHGIQPLLEQVGLDIRPLPLGSLQPEANSENIQFQDAWALAERSDGNGEVLCSAWEYAVAVRCALGKGSVVLIGDSEFLLNKNLEGVQRYSAPNIQFLKRILSTMQGEME